MEWYLTRRRWFVAGILSAISGCAIDRVGAIAARIDRADGAIVYTTHSAGIHLRSTPTDPGLSVGYSKRICLAEISTGSPVSGWYFFFVPALPAPCYALDRSTIGSEIRIGPADYSLTLGARFTTSLVEIPSDASEHYTLFFDTKEPSRAFLRVHQHRRQP